jgi:hypothetical protein
VQVRVGDTVRIGHGLDGQVQEVLTKGATIDPLTVEEVDGTPEDPALIVVTADGIKTAILFSEVEHHMPGGRLEAKTGAAVTWTDDDGSAQYGRVELVVDSGELPGVDGAGTKEAPVARVAVWRPDGGGGWSPAGLKAAVPVSELEVLPPIPSAPATSGMAALVGLLTAHEAAAEAKGLPRDAVPSGRAVKAVYERGIGSWPGEQVTSVGAEDWALGRVKAFLEVAGGGPGPDGYTADRDLLPTR